MHARVPSRRSSESARRERLAREDPRADLLLRMQRSAGNHAVARMMSATEEEEAESTGGGFWGALDVFNPRYYVPTAVGGYTPQDLQGFENPTPAFGVEDFPAAAELAFKRAFKIVARDDLKTRPDYVTRVEYDRTAQLIGDIWRGATRLVLGKTLANESKMEEEEIDAAKYDLMVETLKDVVELARTVTGRDLLTAVAGAASSVPKVIIDANELVVAPAANPRDRSAPANRPQTSDVTYTPTAYKAGRAPNAAENLAQMKAAKRHNPWLMPHRSDITLYHELTHAFHTQTGATKEKDALVGAQGSHVDPVDAVDAPYVGTGFDEGKAKGVSEEEYATVGLGPYVDDRFTENRYRRERRQLGEDVPDRPYYTDKDARGLRPGS